MVQQDPEDSWVPSHALPWDTSGTSLISLAITVCRAEIWFTRQKSSHGHVYNALWNTQTKSVIQVQKYCYYSSGYGLCTQGKPSKQFLLSKESFKYVSMFMPLQLDITGAGSNRALPQFQLLFILLVYVFLSRSNKN